MQLTCLIVAHHHVWWHSIPQIQLNIKGVSVAPHFTLATENADNTLGTSKLKLQISITSNKMALELKQAMTEQLNEGAVAASTWFQLGPRIETTVTLVAQSLCYVG